MGVVIFIILFVFISIVLFLVGLVLFIISLIGRHHKLMIIAAIIMVIAFLIFLPQAKSVYTFVESKIEDYHYSLSLEGEADNNNYNAVEKLLQGGESPNKSYYNIGFTPLMCACCNKEEKIVALLLKYHADPNLTSIKDGAQPGYTALMYSVNDDANLSIVKMLIKAGAKVDYIAPNKQSALSLAKGSGSMEIYNYLKALK